MTVTHGAFARRLSVRLTVLPALLVLPQLASAQRSGPFASNVLSGWQLAVGVGGGWDSNVQLEADNPGSVSSSRVRAEGARLWRGRRSEVALTAGGALVRYPQQRELNRTAYDFSASARRVFTRSATGDLAVRARSDLINRGITGNGDGSVLPGFVTARSNDARGSLDLRLTPEMGSRFAAAVQRVVTSGAIATTGNFALASAELRRRRGEFGTFGSSLVYQRTSIDSVSLTVPQWLGFVDQQWSKLLSGRLSAGLALGNQAGVRSLSDRLVVDGSLSLHGLRNQLAVDARRSIGQEFGRETPGAQVNNVLGVRVDRAMSRTLRLSGRASQGWTNSTSGDRPDIRSTDGGVDLRYQSPFGLQVAFGAFVLRRREFDARVNRGVTVSVGYGWSQLRIAAPTVVP